MLAPRSATHTRIGLTSTALIMSILACFWDSVGAATFTTRNIGQSSCFPGATNTITVTMGTDVDLAQKSTVNISGLTGAIIATGPITLMDAGDDGEITFARGTKVSEAAWSDGTLVLTVKGGGNLSAGTIYTIGFLISNPASATSSPVVSIAAAGSATIGPVAMNKPGSRLYGVLNGSDPLTVVVPHFRVKSIRQSTTAYGELNAIVVTLLANYDLGVGSTVTVEGLTGSQTPDSQGLSVWSTSDMLGTTGVWTNSTGTLVLSVTSGGFEAGTACEVTFTLTNSFTAQESPPVRIQASIKHANSTMGNIGKGAMTKSNGTICGIQQGASPLTIVAAALSCADGTFPGQTRCEVCPAGFVCNRKSSRPTPCPRGTASSAGGLASVSQCLGCPTGFVALSEGSTNCTVFALYIIGYLYVYMYVWVYIYVCIYM